jgi:hypothetical protein
MTEYAPQIRRLLALILAGFGLLFLPETRDVTLGE